MHVSNMFYNDGLDKANVRDLSGAVVSLRQSLKFNKNNVEARNLLGLVYFEMGEVVAALSEWVISKNLRPEKNIADDYIGRLQSNAVRLDSINQTIKKYNQALVYCMQDSKDLAVIQLKKVLSLNPKFVRAHQLLALLYMDGEHWEKAERELKKCKVIDCNNTQTLRYLQEVEQMLLPDENGKQPKGRKKEEAVRYQTDNEIIIQPMGVTESKGGAISTLLNIALGVFIGMVAMYFLAIPGAEMAAKEEAKKSEQEIVKQLDAKTATVKDLETQMTSLRNTNEELNNKIAEYEGKDGTLSNFDALLLAANIYISTGDMAQTAEQLEKVDQAMNDTSAAYQELYQTLIGAIGPNLSETYFKAGTDAARGEEYETAIENLQKAFAYNPQNVEALYELANSYAKSENVKKAVETYEKLLELFPDSEYAERAQRYKDNLTNTEE